MVPDTFMLIVTLCTTRIFSTTHNKNHKESLSFDKHPPHLSIMVIQQHITKNTKNYWVLIPNDANKNNKRMMIAKQAT